MEDAVGQMEQYLLIHGGIPPFEGCSLIVLGPSLLILFFFYIIFTFSCQWEWERWGKLERDGSNMYPNGILARGSRAEGQSCTHI